MCLYPYNSGSTHKILCSGGKYWLPSFNSSFADISSEACDLTWHQCQDWSDLGLQVQTQSGCCRWQSASWLMGLFGLSTMKTELLTTFVTKLCKADHKNELWSYCTCQIPLEMCSWLLPVYPSQRVFISCPKVFCRSLAADHLVVQEWWIPCVHLLLL